MCRRVTVVGCVCVSGTESAKKTYGLPQRCNRLIYDIFLQSYSIRVAAVLAQLLAILFALAGARAYIHSRCSRSLGTFIMGFAIVFGAPLYTTLALYHHWTLT